MTIVTGDRPTGQLHLGHYVGSLKNRLSLQGSNVMFIIVADTQVMNNDMMKCREARKYSVEIVKDYLAIGLDPALVTIFLQSDIPELFELTNYLTNITTLSQVLRNPTIKFENLLNKEGMSLGFVNYPVSQTADVVMFDGEYVPVGADQVPILDLANDLIQRFNHLFGQEFFRYIHPMLSATPRLLSNGGKKMSKSLGNALYLSDDEKTVNEFVHAMYTDKDHLKVSDPGKIEFNTVFAYLDAFHEDKDELAELKAHYQRGGLGDMTLKRMLMADINGLLGPIREARAAITDDHARDVLSEGTARARKVAIQRMEKIKEVIFG